jgi:diaminohydroxyphosphoribosylaminopyrimidine deaminase/5-amino-6-(5-phosphoribosylamino)uracil reductase
MTHAVQSQVDPMATQERTHLARALELAARGLYTTDPNPRVGCVVVREGRVIGEGWHERAGEPHAEVLALRAAGPEARGACVYVTLEPCSHTGRTPPCADALIAAGVARVVCCTVDPNPRVAGSGIERLRAAGIAVSVGVLAAEARDLNVGFFSRFERGRPFIRLKLAMSLDARTGPADGGRAWISGEAARADVQTWRARSGAILTGAGTVRADCSIPCSHARPVRSCFTERAHWCLPQPMPRCVRKIPHESSACRERRAAWICVRSLRV